MIDDVVTLHSGEKGKVVGQLSTGDYVLEYGKGGKITTFGVEDIKEETNGKSQSKNTTGHRYTEEEKEAIIEEFLESGETVRSFSKDKPFSHGSLRRWLIASDKHTPSPAHTRVYTQREKEKHIQEYLESNESFYEFSKDKEISDTTLKRWIKEEGIESISYYEQEKKEEERIKDSMKKIGKDYETGAYNYQELADKYSVSKKVVYDSIQKYVDLSKIPVWNHPIPYRRKAVEDYESGAMSIYEAAKKYDIAPETLQRWRQEFGVTGKTGKYDYYYTQGFKNRVIDELEEGNLTLKELSEKHGVSTQAINTWRNIRKYSEQK